MIEINDHRLWEKYAGLGKVETNWVIDNFPEKTEIIALQGLFYAPQKTIPILFSSAINDNRPLNSATNHPLRIIQDWIQLAEPGTDDAIKNRVILLDETIKWLENGGNTEIGIKAFKSVFSPRYESSSSNPGNGMRITFHFGCLTVSEINQLFPLWIQVIEVIRKMTFTQWDLLFDILRDWLYPGRLHENPTKRFVLKCEIWV